MSPEGQIKLYKEFLRHSKGVLSKAEKTALTAEILRLKKIVDSQVMRFYESKINKR